MSYEKPVRYGIWELGNGPLAYGSPLLHPKRQQHIPPGRAIADGVAGTDVKHAADGNSAG